MQSNNIRNSKPAERQGRKAMGLPFRRAGSGLPGCRRQDHFTLGEPGYLPGSFCRNLIIIRSIKANLLKSRDAKPWVYHHASRDQDSQATESELRKFAGQI
jgi:hypothetical protein